MFDFSIATKYLDLQIHKKTAYVRFFRSEWSWIHADYGFDGNGGYGAEYDD